MKTTQAQVAFDRLDQTVYITIRGASRLDLSSMQRLQEGVFAYLSDQGDIAGIHIDLRALRSLSRWRHRLRGVLGSELARHALASTKGYGSRVDAFDLSASVLWDLQSRLGLIGNPQDQTGDLRVATHPLDVLEPPPATSIVVNPSPEPERAADCRGAFRAPVPEALQEVLGPYLFGRVAHDGVVIRTRLFPPNVSAIPVLATADARSWIKTGHLRSGGSGGIVRLEIDDGFSTYDLLELTIFGEAAA